jgi:hypothetical protein
MNNVVVDYGVAYDVYFDVYITANPEARATAFTPAANDVKISSDAGVTFTGTTNTATFANGILKCSLTAAEMQAARLIVKFEDQDAALVNDSFVEIYTKNHASAFYSGIDVSTDANGRVDVGSVAGTAQTANDNGADINAILVDTNELQTNQGNWVTATGFATATELAKVPKSDGTSTWNATALASINAEADTALADYDAPTNTEMVAAFTEIKGATWASGTDTLEALRDRGDSAWITAIGFATETKQDATDIVIAELTTQGDTNETKLDTISTAVVTTIPGLIDDIGVKKNTAFSNFEFLMVLTSDHVTPATGLTITGQRSIDGGAFTSVSGSIAEVSNGIYQFDALAADTNGDVITWRFSSATADDAFITFKTVA